MYATQLNHLSIQGPRAATWGHIWLAHPSRESFVAKGQLIVLLELPSTNARLQVAAADLITGIEEAYYSDPQDSLELSLESALRRANAELPALASGFSKRWADTTRAVVAVHRDDLLVFATVGSVWTFLLTPHRTTTVTDGSRHGTVNPLKPFGSLTSGHLPQNSSICFTTGTLLDYVSTEKLRKLCLQMSPLGVTQRLEQLLEDASPQLNVLTVILRRSAVSTSADGASVTAADVTMSSERSMKSLAARRDQAATLTGVPSLRQSLNRRAANVNRAIMAAWNVAKNPELWRSAKAKVARQAAVVSTAFRDTSGRARKVVPYLWPPSRWLGGAAVAASVPIRKARQLNRYAAAVVLVAAAAAVAVAHGTIIQLSNRSQNVAVSEEWQSQARAAAEEATSALIYGDEERAADALTTLRGLLSSLPEAQRGLPAAAEAARSFDQLSSQLGRFVDLGELTPIGSLPGGAGQLALLSGKLWAATPAGLATLEVASGSSTVVAALPSSGPIAAADRTVAVVTTGGVVASDGGRTPATVPLSRAAGHGADTAAALYLGRLYVLDGPAGQLFRYRRVGGSFTEQTAWLSTAAEPGKHLAVAIDGQAYLLTATGVERYTQGVNDGFKPSGIWPPAAQLTHLAASGANLYLLEPGQGRLIVISKRTGAVERQYRADALRRATALAIDGDRTAYVAAGEQVLSVDLTKR